MSAYEYRWHELTCDGDSFRCRARLKGELTEGRAALRRRAAKDGWTHVHKEYTPRGWDKDYCPEHKPAEVEP